MKTLQFRLAGAVTALALGLTFLFAGSQAQAAANPDAATGATISKMTGRATVFLPDGTKVRASVGMKLSQGSTISTGFGSVTLDLDPHGVAVIRPRSSLTIDELSRVKDQEVTRFNLKKGELVGDVKKVAQNSVYEVQTAKGVAGIRGTQYRILSVGVFICANGQYQVTLAGINQETGKPKVFVIRTNSKLDVTKVVQQVANLTPAEAQKLVTELQPGGKPVNPTVGGGGRPAPVEITITGGVGDNGRLFQRINAGDIHYDE